MTPLDWVNLGIKYGPQAITLIQDIIALFKKHPALTPADLGALSAQITSVDDATLATIAADQAANPAK